MFVDRHLGCSFGKPNTLTMPDWQNLNVLFGMLQKAALGPYVSGEGSLLTRALQGLGSLYKDVNRIAFMTHFHGTGSLAPAILWCLSLPATIISLSPSHSMFRHSAPSPHSLAQGLSVFIWSSLSQAILYLPCVTKLLHASDKDRNPGTGTWRITSLAVCLSLIFRPAGSQTHTPLSHEGSYDCFVFVFFSPDAVRW